MAKVAGGGGKRKSPGSPTGGGPMPGGYAKHIPAKPYTPGGPRVHGVATVSPTAGQANGPYFNENKGGTVRTPSKTEAKTGRQGIRPPFDVAPSPYTINLPKKKR